MVSLSRFSALCLLLSVCAEVVTAQTCNPTDDSALQYFYREVVWARTEFSTWVEGTDCCTWNGVSCDGAGNVVNLTIVNIDENPPYPGGSPYVIGTGILGLKSLSSLVMKNVAFNGEIPASWGTLTNLKILDLESCNIVGTLPPELCQLAELFTFNFFDNLFNGALAACYKTPQTTFPNALFNISGNSFSS